MKCYNLFFSHFRQLRSACLLLKHYWIFSLWPQKNRKTGPCWEKCIWKQFTENWFLPGSAFHKGLVQCPWKKCTERGNNVINVNLQKAGFTCTDIKTLPMQSLSVFTIRKCIYLLMPRQITTKYQLCFAVFSNLPRG